MSFKWPSQVLDWPNWRPPRGAGKEVTQQQLMSREPRVGQCGDRTKKKNTQHLTLGNGEAEGQPLGRLLESITGQSPSGVLEKESLEVSCLRQVIAGVKDALVGTETNSRLRERN